MESRFDTYLEAIDWRSSAAILGLIRYFKYHEIEIDEDKDGINYCKNDISEEKYLEFAEVHFKREMHHKDVESWITENDESEENIKRVNEKLVANTIMKKYFGKLKYDGKNGNDILQIINRNRYEIIKETYKNKKNLYANFCNVNQFFNEGQSYCRLKGYYVDSGKKGKSAGYNFNQGSFVGTDRLEYDFIPFAFSIGREAVFINDNSDVKELKITNDMLISNIEDAIQKEDGRGRDVRRIFFSTLIQSSDFINFDVEVVLKDIEKDYFETLILRKSSIRILKSIGIDDYEKLCFSYKVNDNYYINVQKKVTNAIINNILLDDLIEFFLKEERKSEKNFSFAISKLIKINLLIRVEIFSKEKGEDDEMEKHLKGAYACAKKIAGKLEENKINSYKTKLISAITFKDYDRVCNILLQLSNYSDVPVDFAYDLFSDFEGNKDLAYTFINALYKENNKGNKEGEV